MTAFNFSGTHLQSTNKEMINLFENDSFTMNEIIDILLKYLKQKHKMSIVNWESASKGYPSYMFLSGDKGILAYIDFKYIKSNCKFSETNNLFSTDSLLETIRVADSQLDRPVFFVYILNCEDKQGIFFETNEQIKDRWFTNQYCQKEYSPILEEAGDMPNLISIFQALKQNGVHYY